MENTCLGKKDLLPTKVIRGEPTFLTTKIGNLANSLHEKQNVTAATPDYPPRRATYLFSIKQLWLAQPGKLGIDKTIRTCTSTVVSSWLGGDEHLFSHVFLGTAQPPHPQASLLLSQHCYNRYNREL